MMSYTNYKAIAGVVVLSLGVLSCSKVYDLPEDKDFISENLIYSTQILEATMGRTSVFNPLNSDNSTLPLHFEIVNPRFGDGTPAADFLQPAETYEWIQEYDGEETSIEEIESKRRLVTKPMFEVDSGGRFIMHASATNELIKPRPTDSVLKTQDIRFFDLKLSNSGGIRYVKDFQLIPWRELDYEPSDLNPYTGEIAPDPVSPNDPRKRMYLVPSRMQNIVGENTNIDLVNNELKKDVVVYIRPFEGGNGNKLRIKFLDSDENPIHPDDFNETRWDEMFHGFNRTITSEYVEYDVLYPIPLTTNKTPYGSGGWANLDIKYSRLGWGGIRVLGEMTFDFKIFKKGDWEIVFHFRNDNPKFENE
ncbi:MAG: DUF5007 domain-containing protein [Sphingobacterium sp.]|uniref:DUF5007 domain-containing protein n=1 Tax=Sphingobacterium sp. JB170 TaxID=1434842 RepID=UPI00097ECCE5|nr:DUF5007 domain-containing protein [Sphingobacterium sp. JB170]SJN37056.1 hypothetical protein FM107_09170 [Sphingobacterium sp. JB170]